MKKLPIGIQTFEEIIRDNYLYIDKTKYIYDLVENGKVYFLSRPRRFGKSVLISTLEALYKNKKELFKSLWIEKTAYNWQEYPVIRIDFSALSNTNADELDYSIKNKLLNIALDYNIDLKEKNVLKIIFEELIRKLSKINKVVVLIDEYDKPIIDNILNKKIAIKNRAVLKNFYGTLKPCDEYLKFVLLTGVSKFSQVSIFSDLNNLNDITMSTNCVKLVGCTEEELEEYFKEYSTKLAEGNNVSYEEIREKIKYWYNGFRFSREKTAVYNPFSLLLLFNHLEFQNYWFETATPTFLLNLIKEHNYDIRDLDNKEVDSFSFSSYEVDNLQVLPLLYQTGYLTIKGYRDDRMLYTLGYPNFEVEDSFIRHLVALV